MPMFPFDFELPPELIAQEPIEPRDHARLLLVDRHTQSLEHRRFFELPSLLRPNDLLILNDTRVLHARLLGHRQTTGGRWEGLFLKPLPDGCWEMLCQTRGRLKLGEIIVIDPGPLTLELIEKLPTGKWRVRPLSDEPMPSLLDRHGQVPLPPYIRKGQAAPGDRLRYQTVFARQPGAVAAPTAGLHFTPEVFAALKGCSVDWAFVTLHVGLGTFQPIQVDDYRLHPMHFEWGELPAATVAAIEHCRNSGGRVVAVGTTAVRVLETVGQTGEVRPWSGETNLFIYPPYKFRVVQGLITNFHLPKTTLLLLVSAMAGVELMERAYRAAIAEKYRFYSYGDAMLIV